MGSQRVGHDRGASTYLLTYTGVLKKCLLSEWIYGLRWKSELRHGLGRYLSGMCLFRSALRGNTDG